LLLRRPPPRPDREIHWIVTHGIRNTAMGAWARLMTDPEIWTVSTFVSRLRSLREDIAAQWAAP